MNEKRYLRNTGVGLLLILALIAITLSVVSVTTRARSNVSALSWSDAPIVPANRYINASAEPVSRQNDTQLVGDTTEFVLLDGFRRRSGILNLHLRTEHANFWFETGVLPDATKLAHAAETFEDQIWPVMHDVFGLDDDIRRVNLVHQASISDHIVGAFNVEDQCPKTLCPNSNERDVLYINLELAPLGSPDYFALIAHEFQHLIRYKNDGNERVWLDEGLAQFAQFINGYPVSQEKIRTFLETPDHRLNSWTIYGAETDRYYGAA